MSAEEQRPDEHDDDDQQDRATTDVDAVGDETEHAERVPSRIDYQANLPRYMRSLPLDEAGRPVPKFVEWVDGKPDFRFMSSKQLRYAVMNRVCWVCGTTLGKFAVFPVGPMCLINLNSAEPPSHYDCALYAALHCPFLLNPNKVRREANLPTEGLQEPAGVMIRRNPGVTCLIVVRRWIAWQPAEGGVLFNIGGNQINDRTEVERVEWYREGRKASRTEVVDSIESGVPALAETCDGDPVCLRYLQRKLREAERWLPDE